MSIGFFNREHTNFIVNLGLLISGIATVFSGLLIQVKYHMGNHDTLVKIDSESGINYKGWSDIHKISIVVLTALMLFHIYHHWKWYKAVIMKKLFAKNRQVLFLSTVFVLVAITGLLPWLIDLVNGDGMLRKGFIEIHDKLAIVLSVLLISHIIKRFNWFLTAFEKFQNKRSSQKYIYEEMECS